MRLILTYTAEIRPDALKTRQILEGTEMQILKMAAGKCSREHTHSHNIWMLCDNEAISDGLVLFLM